MFDIFCCPTVEKSGASSLWHSRSSKKAIKRGVISGAFSLKRDLTPSSEMPPNNIFKRMQNWVSGSILFKTLGEKLSFLLYSALVIHCSSSKFKIFIHCVPSKSFTFIFCHNFFVKPWIYVLGVNIWGGLGF